MGGPTVNVFLLLMLLMMFSGELLAQATTNLTTTVENTTSGMSSVSMTTVAMTTAAVTTNRAGITTTGSMTEPVMSSTLIIIVSIVCGTIVFILFGIALIVLACRIGRRRGRPEQRKQDVESAGTPSTGSGHASRPATPGDEPGGTELIPLSDLPGGKARRAAPPSPPRTSSRDETEWVPFAQLEAARNNSDSPEPPPSDSSGGDADIYAVIPDRKEPKDEDDKLYDTPPAGEDDDDNLYDIPPIENDCDDDLYDTPPIEDDEDFYSTIGESTLTKSAPQEDEDLTPPEGAVDQMYAKVDKSKKKRPTHHEDRYPALEAKEGPPEDTGNYYFTLEEVTGLKKETAAVEKDKRRPATWPTESSEGRQRIQGEI
ncbi:uncharacterized protein [Branchiostoma lanceolatum]|uniref:uncharacterized protein n=1 Tax=Branchiostoma lanceolatum TaxID=7740 RepID=UPI003454D1D9